MSKELEEKRAAEHAKYAEAYRDADYRIVTVKAGKRRANRLDWAVHDLEALPCRGSYLDVSCGWGDVMHEAAKMGYDPVHGTEIVKSLLKPGLVDYAEVHALPFADKFYNVVSLFDVIEHLIPGDDERACKELARVARKHVLISACNKPSHHNGIDLHINRRPYAEWDGLFNKWFPGRVKWLKRRAKTVSETWRIDL